MFELTNFAILLSIEYSAVQRAKEEYEVQLNFIGLHLSNSCWL